MKRLITFMLLIVMLMSSVVLASERDSYTFVGSTGEAFNYPTQCRAGSWFIANTSYSMTALSMKLTKQNSATGFFRLRLFNATRAGGASPSTYLSVSKNNYSVTLLTGTYTEYMFNFSTPIDVIKGRAYAAVLDENVSCSLENYNNYLIASRTGYNTFESHDNFVTWNGVDAGYQMWFRTFTENLTVPVPDIVSTIKWINLTPFNNSYRSSSADFYYNLNSSATSVLCNFYTNNKLNQTANVSPNAQHSFNYAISVGEQQVIEASISCRSEVGNDSKMTNSSLKEVTFDSVNPLVNIYTPNNNGTRYYRPNFLLNVTNANINLNTTLFQIYNNSGYVLAKNRTYEYNNSIKVYNFAISNLTIGKNYVNSYATDHAGLSTNVTRYMYIMNCPQLTELWTKTYLNSCQVSDLRNYTYLDINTCGTYLDNTSAVLGTIEESCNYCTSTFSSSLTTCTNNQQVQYYAYSNTCCADTGLPSDCNLPSNQTISCGATLATGAIVGILGDTGRGIGELSNGITSGGFIKLLIIFGILGGIILMFAGVGSYIVKSIKR